MVISCDIIRDLLPLYAEDMTSPDSNKLVDEHLCTCDACTKQLGILKKAAQLPVEVDTGALKRVENIIRRKRILTVAVAVMTVITLLVSIVGWLNVTVYPEPEDAVITVEAQEDGTLRYTVCDYIRGHSSFGWHQAGYEYQCFAHIWNTTRLDYLTSLWNRWRGTPGQPKYFEDRNDWRAVGEWGSIKEIPESAKETVRMENCHHWYLDAYSGEILQKLWGEAGTLEPEPLLSHCNDMQSNFWGALCLAAVFVASTNIPMKPWVKELLTRFAILSGSVAGSQLFLTGGKFVSVYVSDEPFRILRWVYVISVFLTLTILFWRQLYLLNKQDKGI